MAGLTRDRILTTAIELADREGFQSVTLRRIAGELGVHVTSLYNHVPTREAVTDGIIELLIAEAGLPTMELAWEQWVRRFFAALGTIAAVHPGAFTALQHRPVQGPRAAASFEVGLAAFARAGLGPDDAYHAVKAAALTALSVGMERSMATSGPLAQTVLDELPPERFPALLSVPASTNPEAAWSFSLETLVAGLRAQLVARQIPSSAAGDPSQN